MTLASIATQKIQTARHEKERLFWLGAILAGYAQITGSQLADKAAEEILDETEEWMLKNYKPSPSPIKDK